ncbi:MAG: hypothetical protein M3Q65_17885 [Chloroflexota bacterium]|nr:hypothetical protein [Chloroflexota bacterium]
MAETDAIFAQVNRVNQAADAAEDVVRLSMDAKATVRVGPFSRGGTSRVPVAAADHDFQPAATVTPVGILLPATDELFLYGVTSTVTSDCLVDGLTRWWETVRGRFAHVTTGRVNNYASQVAVAGSPMTTNHLSSWGRRVSCASTAAIACLLKRTPRR